MTMFLMSLNEFGDVYNEFDNTDHPYLAKVKINQKIKTVTARFMSYTLVVIPHLHDSGVNSSGQHADCHDGTYL